MQTQTTDATQQVLAQLEQAIAAGGIAASYRKWAADLLGRLQKPVQVMIIGRPGVGKSGLIDALLGQPVLRGMSGTPEIHIAPGQTSRCYVEYYDGQSEWRQGLLSEQGFDQPVARAYQELPDPTLAERNLIEIGLPETEPETQNVMKQAMDSADILIWCVRRFSQLDVKLLDVVPDRLRDHGFLVLMGADGHETGAAPAELQGSELRSLAAEFLGLYPFSFGPPEGLNEHNRRLKLHLDRQIDLGRAADLDQARMILRQTTPSPLPVSPKPNAQPLPPAKRRVEEAAADLLRTAGQELLIQLDQTDGQIESQIVLEHCRRTLDTLSEMLAEDRATGHSLDLVEAGQEMLLLIQLEKGRTSAQDAVTLLLQLRRELSALEAA